MTDPRMKYLLRTGIIPIVDVNRRFPSGYAANH
jgi:hypothetical protein